MSTEDLVFQAENPFSTKMESGEIITSDAIGTRVTKNGELVNEEDWSLETKERMNKIKIENNKIAKNYQKILSSNPKLKKKMEELKKFEEYKLKENLNHIVTIEDYLRWTITNRRALK